VSQKHHARPTRADLLLDEAVAQTFPEHVPRHNAMVRGVGNGVKNGGERIAAKVFQDEDFTGPK
jgi:hypothetical protein